MTNDDRGEVIPSEDLNRESRRIWDGNAPFWDDHMGDEGNAFHRELVAPVAERLLVLKPGEAVLEIACGTGLFARRMAELGARVVATDFSAAFLERARSRTAAYADRIEFRRVDATDPRELSALGEHRFDAAVCNMALMDIADVTPLFSALPLLLKPGGRFVFTVSHPCFNTTGCARVVEQEDRGGEIVTTYSVKVSRYKGLSPAKGIGIQGQPHPHNYFDRTISDLLGYGFRAGLALDGMEEPASPAPAENASVLSTSRFHEIPMVLAARMRVPE